jgi:hypothetical protein
MVTNPWIQVAKDLDNLYADQYLYAQAYTSASQNIMEVLIPPQFYVDQFGNKYNTADVIFGTKVLTLFIAQATYGWTNSGGTSDFTWNDPTSDYSQMVSSSVVYWLKLYPLFTKYQCLIWTDLYTPTLVQTECPNMGEQMTQTDSYLKTFCMGVPGFTYMGQITTQVPASFFQPFIDAFYGNPNLPAYRDFSGS